MKKALITGITGQDGSYLTELLLAYDYEVHGIIRRSSTFNTERIDHLISDWYKDDNLILHHGDLTDAEQTSSLIYNIQPDEIYNLGAQSHVRVSFDMPEFTTNVVALGTTRILESIRRSENDIKFYQASSSEMFGESPPPQNEETLFAPRSPYACAKTYAYWMVKNYREGYNLFASNGILFNHESPRRGGTFVTKKITMALANILAEIQEKLYLGNLESKRDWGYAPEYVEVMWNILQLKKPGDFVVGTGETHSIREFLELAFGYVGLDYENYIEIDPRYYRPTEVENLTADIEKAKNELKWRPKIKFKDLIKIMVDADMRKVGLEVIGEGDEILKKKFPNRYWTVD
ncbi:MAG: GDP-mannose 4,6-dehydratase [Methanobacteriaceae archaeon]